MLNRKEALNKLKFIREKFLRDLLFPSKIINDEEYLNIKLIITMLERLVEAGFEADPNIEANADTAVRYVSFKPNDDGATKKAKVQNETKIEIELKETKKEKLSTTKNVVEQGNKGQDYIPSQEEIFSLVSAFIKDVSDSDSLYSLFLDYKGRELLAHGDVDLDLLRLLLREFNDIIQQKCIAPLPYDKKNYFEVFGQLVKVTKYGELTGMTWLSDQESFPLVSTLLKMQGLEPGDDFFIAYQDIRPAYLLLFIHFVAFHDVLDKILPETTAAGKLEPSRLTTASYNQMLRFVFLEHNHLKSFKTEEQINWLVTHLLNRASSETWLTIIMAVDKIESVISKSESLLTLFLKNLTIAKQHNSNTVVETAVPLLKNIFVKVVELNSDESKKVAAQIFEAFSRMGDQNNDPIFYQAYLKLLANKEYQLAEKLDDFLSGIVNSESRGGREDGVLNHFLDERISFYQSYIASLETREPSLTKITVETKEDEHKQDKEQKDTLAEQQLASFYSAVTNYARMLLTPKPSMPPLIQALMEAKGDSPAAFEWLLNQKQIDIDAKHKGETALGIAKRTNDKEKANLILQFKLKQILPVFNQAETSSESFQKTNPTVNEHLAKIKKAITTLVSADKLEGESISTAITIARDECTNLLAGLDAKKSVSVFKAAAKAGPEKQLIEPVKQILSIAQDLFELQKMAININIPKS
ncbi:MAG: hypothetical protein ABI370_14520 [Gammaproteobacteria bacterium]